MKISTLLAITLIVSLKIQIVAAMDLKAVFVPKSSVSHVSLGALSMGGHVPWGRLHPESKRPLLEKAKIKLCFCRAHEAACRGAAAWASEV